MAPVQHFMLADLWRSLLAVNLYPLFVLIPGYSLAWLLDLCRFRRRTPAFRIALSICLSIAVCPLATYLVERFGSALAVWAMYGTALLYFAVLKTRDWRQARPVQAFPKDRAMAVIVLVWVALALLSLADLQFGRRDYYSITALDFSVRTAFTHSLASGIPPHNPFYFPGHPEPVRYHYFWLILCAMVERTNLGVGPRHAWIGGVVWCGIGMMAVVALTFRLLLYQGPANFRRRALIGILLLGVTGLDILPALLGWVLHLRGMPQAVLASIDWWNLKEQVCGFLSTALWEAHHLAGLVACMTAFLLLWEGARETAWSTRARYAVVAGFAVASALGVSIYVTIVFGAFLAVWTLVTAVKKWWPEAALCAVAGVTAVVCAMPYLLDMRAPAGSAGGPPPFQLHVRPFTAMVAVLQSVGIVKEWQLSLANLAMLPMNYFLEFGFFFAAARFWWSRRQRPLSREHLATAVMLATSLLICTFVRSSVISNNDLGWRGILVTQFVVLLWAVDVFTGASGAMDAQFRRMLGVLVLLGAAGTVYDLAILRLYPWMADRGTVGTLAWMSRDHHLGERNYAQREAYEWLNANSPPETRLQYNPHVDLQETAAFLYAERQMVAANESCLAAFGGDPALCPPMQQVLDRFYPVSGKPAPASIADACRSLPVDVMVAKDTDAVWRDPQSWVWQDKPIFENRFVRMLGCGH